MKGKLLPFAVFLMLALGLLGWGCGSKERASSATLRIGVQSNLASALLIQAKAEGAFAAQGLDVDLVMYPSGKRALEGLFAGEVDLATSAEMPLSVAALEGKEFKIFAEICELTDGAWIVADRERGIHSASDLRGKRIGTQKHSAVHYFLIRFLQAREIELTELQLLFFPAEELHERLLAGDIDAYSMRNPFIAETLKALGPRAVEFHDPVIYVQMFCLAGTPEIRTRSPEELVGILEVLHRQERKPLDLNKIAGFLNVDPKLLQDDVERHQPLLTLRQELILMMEAELAMLQEGAEPREINVLNWICSDELMQVTPAAVKLIR